MSERKFLSGKFIQIEDKIKAFIPGSIPGPEDIELDNELIKLLSQAHVDIGRLDGASSMLPDPDLFVMMYIKKEAVLSSKIEGTQASLVDVLEFEANALDPDRPKDVREVVNYVGSMTFGIERLRSGERLDLTLIKEMHSRLMKDSRGGDLEPGRFRDIQNWIAPQGCSLKDAVFVPPPPDEMRRSLQELEEYMIRSDPFPALVRSALIHSQFESIHPFLDGNGRMGRLLITLFLIREGILRYPLLYLSNYLLKHRSRYYDRLQSLREDGDYWSWIKFFLIGVSEVSIGSYEKTLNIIEMKEKRRKTISENMGRNSPRAISLYEEMFRKPIMNIHGISRITGLTYQSSNKLASDLESIGILVEVTGHRRNRVFEFKEYMDILSR